MHGRTPPRPVWILGISLIWIASTAVGQEVWPARLPADPAYEYADPSLQTSSDNATPATGAVFNMKGSLADRVADLENKLARMNSKEAAAKKKAAEKPTVYAGGRLMVDWAAFTQNNASRNQARDFENGTEVRHARLFLKGDAFHVVDYKLQFEIAKTTEVRNPVGTGRKGIGQISFKDIYITIKELPVLGNVRVGHFKTPFGLEQLTSFRFSTFMERAMVMEGEVEGRRMGVMAFDHAESERFTWAIGTFTSQIPENPPIFRNDSAGTAGNVRFTFLPWYDEATEGRGLMHLGICYAYSDIAKGNEVNFFERPEAHLGNVIIDAGELADVDDISSMCAEAALVYGPFSFQAEYVPFWLDRTENIDAFFHGGYAYVSYFLTGENRRYDRTRGVFTRVKPFENFFRVRDCDGEVHTGIGAWEVAYRYSYMDLNSNGINGGRAGNHTFGLNWYLNPYTEIMFNYVHSETRDSPEAPGVGQVDILQMRCRINF